MSLRTHRILLGTVASSYIIAAQHQQQLIEPFSFLFYTYAFISFALSCFAGLCSGLTVGYMSIAKSQMEIFAKSEDQRQRKIGETILSVLSNHHLLLSTLLLSNALALEALPIFLDKIVPSYLAIIISTAAVVVFGEVLPQAYCTGPSRVAIGYYLAPVTKFLQFILYPFVAPITYVLDHWLGHHQDKLILTKQNLKALLFLHNKKQYGYRPQQIELLQNTLEMRSRIVKDSMIPLKEVYMLEEKTLIDQKTVDQMLKFNFSKVPVFAKERSCVVGYVKAKNLLNFNIKEPKSIKDGGPIPECVKILATESLLNAIDQLRNKKINFAAVVNEAGACQGIITLKQIFEKITLKNFNDDDVRAGFNWNRASKILQVHQGKQQE